MAAAPKVHLDHIETIAAEENIPADIMKTAAAITTAMPKAFGWRQITVEVARAIYAERQRRDGAFPELLEATKRLVTEAKMDAMDRKAGWDCWVSMADQAIAKAEGGGA